MIEVYPFTISFLTNGSSVFTIDPFSMQLTHGEAIASIRAQTIPVRGLPRHIFYLHPASQVQAYHCTCAPSDLLVITFNVFVADILPLTLCENSQLAVVRYLMMHKSHTPLLFMSQNLSIVLSKAL